MPVRWVPQGVWYSMASSSKNKKKGKRKEMSVLPQWAQSLGSLICNIFAPYPFFMTRAKYSLSPNVLWFSSEVCVVWAVREPGFDPINVGSVSCGAPMLPCGTQRVGEPAAWGLLAQGGMSPAQLQAGCSPTVIWCRFLMKTKQACNFCVSWLMKLSLWLLCSFPISEVPGRAEHALEMWPSLGFLWSFHPLLGRIPIIFPPRLGEGLHWH